MAPEPQFPPEAETASNSLGSLESPLILAEEGIQPLAEDQM